MKLWFCHKLYSSKGENKAGRVYKAGILTAGITTRPAVRSSKACKIYRNTSVLFLPLPFRSATETSTPSGIDCILNAQQTAVHCSRSQMLPSGLYPHPGTDCPANTFQQSFYAFQ